LSSHSVSKEHRRETSLLSEGSIQGSRSNRTGGRQGQTLQAYSPTLREDREKLRLSRRTRLRIHLDQIRPHGLVSKSVGILGGVYVIVRGLDNVENGMPLTWRGIWKQAFYGKVAAITSQATAPAAAPDT